MPFLATVLGKGPHTEVLNRHVPYRAQLINRTPGSPDLTPLHVVLCDPGGLKVF